MNVEGGLQLGDFAGIARRRGKLAALTALLVLLASYWIAMALPNVYTSYATVLVEPQSVDQELVRAGVQSSDLTERLHIMTAQILSRPRLSAIIDDVKLYQDESKYMLREEIIDLMRSRVRVAPVVPELERQGSRRREAEPNEFQIYFEDYDPKIAREVAQRLANDFIESHIDSRVAVSQKSLEFIQGELQRLSDQIAQVEGQIARVKNENPGKLPEDLDPSQRRLERVLGDYALVQRELAEATSDEAFYRTQVAQAAAYSAPNDDASPVRRLELLKLDLANLRSRGFTEKHPDIIKTKAEIVEVEAAVEKLKERGEDENVGGSLVEQQAQANLQRSTLRRKAAEAEIERVKDLIDEITALINSTPAVAEQLDALSREYEHLFKSFQDFSSRQLEASVQAQLERRQLGEQFRVLEAAFEAPDPSSPNRWLIIALGAVFGLAIGGLALLLDMLDTSAHDARALQTQLELPVLASIPQIWLEGDRVLLRRKRLRAALATCGLVAFALVGGAANYLWVNGMPRFFSEEPAAEAKTGTPSPAAKPATEG